MHSTKIMLPKSEKKKFYEVIVRTHSVWGIEVVLITGGYITFECLMGIRQVGNTLMKCL